MKWLMLLSLICPALFPLSLPLKVKNDMAQARNAVPVQMGIPFPKGKLAVADVAKLTISDAAANSVVPAGAGSMVVWHDGSVRWVRLLFPATVAANSTANYVLSDANLNVLGGLTAVAGANSVTVNTGKIRFIVRGANFNIIDEAWMDESGNENYDDAHKVVEAGNAGGFYATCNGVPVRSSTTNCTVTLYEQSLYHAIVKVTGKIGQLQFTLFIYAYDDKPYIKVVHRFYVDNNVGTVASLQTISDLSLRLHTKVAGGTVTLSDTTIRDVTTSVAGNEEACLNFENTDYYQVLKGTTVLDSGKGKTAPPLSTGPVHLGWAHMTDNTLGVAGAIRFIWQMAPKNISVFGDGRMELHLWTDKGPTVPYYGGAGRIHFTGFAFTNSVDAAREMFYAVTQPLYAIPPSKWLTWQTRVMGDLAPIDSVSFWDTAATTSLARTGVTLQHKQMGYINGHGKRKQVVLGEDSYGFLAFGDLGDQDPQCGTDRAWANNYYDFPHCMAQAYMVTGSEMNIETGLAHAMHMMDMDHGTVTGQSRTCPGWGHYGDYNLCIIDYSYTTNHYKAQGMFDWAEILAEPILGEVALKVAAWAKTFPGGQERSYASDLEALTAAYAYTNDATWLTDMHQAYTTFNLVNQTGGDFMGAYIGESFMWHYIEDSSYAQITTGLRNWADAWAGRWDGAGFGSAATTEARGGFMAGLVTAARLIPERRAAYLNLCKAVWRLWSENEGRMGDGRAKQFVQRFKGVPHYFPEIIKPEVDLNLPDYWSAVASPVIALERRVAPEKERKLLQVYPNPFNPDVNIAVDLRALENAGKASLRVLDITGGVVADLTRSLEPSMEKNVVRWDASRMPAGVYLVSFNNGNGLQLARKVILAR